MQITTGLQRTIDRSPAARPKPTTAALCALMGVCVFATTAGAQVADRVIQAINPQDRVVLAGQHVEWASALNDQGSLAPDTALEHLSVVLQRSADQQQAFEQLLRDQQDPSSASYHQWLSPTELGSKFGLSQHDIDATSSWLQSQGLQVDAVSNSRTRITFSGTADSVGTAFNTQMHHYLVAGDVRIAASSDPQIPTAIQSVVQSVRGLHTLKHRAYHTTAVRQIAASTPVNKPEDSNCQNSSCTYDIFPSDFATIYGINPVTALGIDGTGQTIVIVGRARVYDTDIESFQFIAGLAKKDPNIIVPPNGIDPGPAQTTCTDSSTCGNANDQSEATLDVERATSVAPGASIQLVVSSDTTSADGSDIATEYAIDTSPLLGHILNISFGSCEGFGFSTASDARALDEEFSQAASEGISVFVASGDQGAAGCDQGTGTPPATQEISANILCASGYVTCVGGTEFADATNSAAYWATTDGANFESALGYIPEGAWNEPLDSKGNPDLAASGGGVSQFIATPVWQTGTGVPGKQGRYTPDVAFSSSAQNGYFACMAAQAPNGQASCVVTNNMFGYLITSGTSAATPSMAGIAALLNQKEGSAQGNLNPRLYALAATPSNGVFHDVTLSSSGVSNCQLSVPSLCNNSTPGPTSLSGGLAGYAVGTGYDEVTGLGSLNVANLLTQWNSNASAAVNLDQHGLTGSWYNPATGGQGFEIEVYPDLVSSGEGLLFAGWFTFDVSAAGGKRWYVLSGDVSNTSSTAQLTIGVVDGGNFNAPPSLGAAAVGSASLTFSDCNTASLNYTFTDGSDRSGTIPLTRLTSNVTCASSGGKGSAPSNYLLSGNWYDPSTSGQGLIFDFNPTQSLLFAAWYTFLPDGQQVGGGASQSWYTLQTGAGGFTPGTTQMSGIPIGETTGGVFNNPTPSTTKQVGTANLAIQSCNAMTLTYNFTSGTNEGKSGTIPLQRTGPVPAGCNL
jgi:pseudomonalisin